MMSSDGNQTPASRCAPGTLEEELEKIEREQTEVVDLEGKERELDALNRRARELATELRTARTSRRQRAAEGALPVIHPREPCAAAWDDMTGNDRVRACGRCKSRVYDLGGLEPSDARRLLRENEGRLPLQVVGRADGTVTTERCSELRRRPSPKTIGLAAAGAVGLLLTGAALGYVLSNEPTPPLATHAAEPVEISALVEELAKAQARANAAQAPPAAPPTPAPPERAAPDTTERDEHRERRRPHCHHRKLRLYDPWIAPFSYFYDDDSCGE